MISKYWLNIGKEDPNRILPELNNDEQPKEHISHTQQEIQPKVQIPKMQITKKKLKSGTPQK